MENVVYIHNGKLFNSKKELNLVICNKRMGLEDILLSKISEAQKEEYCMILLICRC